MASTGFRPVVFRGRYLSLIHIWVKDTYPALKSASNDITSASEKVNTAFQGTLENTDEYRGTLTSETLPALSDSTTKLSNALSGLSTAVSNQSLLIDQSITALDQLNSALQTTASALGQTDGVLAGFQDDIDTVRTDLVALGLSLIHISLRLSEDLGCIRQNL